MHLLGIILFENIYGFKALVKRLKKLFCRRQCRIVGTEKLIEFVVLYHDGVSSFFSC